MNFFWEKVYTTFIFYFIFTVRCLWENWCYNLWQNILCFWKSWTQIQNRDKQIYKKHKNQIKMLNIIKFICKPLFKLNYSCLYFNKGLEKQTWILLTQQKMTKFFLKCTFWFPNALCPVHFYEWSNCTRSFKRSETLFQISLLLFLTWREYFYSQPTHFLASQKSKDLN